MTPVLLKSLSEQPARIGLMTGESVTVEVLS